MKFIHTDIDEQCAKTKLKSRDYRFYDMTVNYPSLVLSMKN